MKASELPEIPGATHFFVRGSYSWGRAAKLEDAIRIAQVHHQQVVHVCRCDPKAYADDIYGNLRYSIRGDIWEGRVQGKKDIALKTISHPSKE